ncbi:MAG TPA: MBL fold metallo-hydrolase [bacterium]|nr:MBL fold metallo-hydrolase [bacterium]HPV65439.1 MBL fold metallo-hydrolase [bacterium]
MKKNKKIIFWLFFLLIIFIVFLNYYLKIRNNKNLNIFFLDSGQADTILIKTPEEQNIIIDLGSKDGLKGVGQQIFWWDRKIDILIITHPHDDHILAIPQLIDKYKINKIIFTGIIYDSPIYEEIIKKAQDKKIKLLIPQINQKILLGKSCELDFLYPLESLKDKKIENINNSSIVNRLKYKNNYFLFMGDSEIDIEEKLLEKNYELKSDVLKVSHHGSISSSHQEFIKKINPKISIIMVGQNNKFNHPSLRTLNKLQKIGSLIFRTDLNGDINITSDGQLIKYKLSSE